MKVHLLMRVSIWRAMYANNDPSFVDVYSDAKVARRIAKEKSSKSRDYEYFVRTKTVKEE